MGTTKTEGFSQQTMKMADALKALGHPARLAIMDFLATRDACFCGDIVEELPLAQSTVSRHLAELKNAGLIQGTISGKNTCYCVNQENWKALQEAFAAMAARVCSPKCC
ncbi:metalloregulator ArsR/SmtB family transcription factor [Limibacter armeniacum]|uniref:ArsR/SmtB family transcription factor n=1 Tax=Limibacter armeniacum TaxID=466084 RepID=UPI002FE53959